MQGSLEFLAKLVEFAGVDVAYCPIVEAVLGPISHIEAVLFRSISPWCSVPGRRDTNKLMTCWRRR